MSLSDPWFLICIPLIAGLLWYVRTRGQPCGMKFSSGDLLGGLRTSWKIRLYKNLTVVRFFALCLVVFALARPRLPLAESKIEVDGIDIVLAIDSSTSMLAEDFKMGNRRKSRIEVVKEVVEEFVKGRSHDRIGVVAFAARAYTISPLTLDYSWLLQNLERVRTGMIEDGTAIGSGIATALNRLRDTKAKSKVVVLLTDGRNNTGKISPRTAAEAAKALKVKVYTIGAGAQGPVPYPAKDFFGNTVYQRVQIDIDEESLREIASITDGKYFRATDTESLREIYKEIDRLEKTIIEEKGYQEYRELFPFFLIPGLFLVLMEIVLSNTILRKIP